MITTEIENNIFEYEGENNVILLPITRFVRKDGNLAIVSPITKLFAEKYPNLTKKWGYIINQEIPFPSYVTSVTQLIGVPNKNHYASAVDLQEFENGLWYIKEECLLKPNIIFYLQYEPFMEETKIKEIFSEINNFVLLKKGEENGTSS